MSLELAAEEARSDSVASLACETKASKSSIFDAYCRVPSVLAQRTAHTQTPSLSGWGRTSCTHAQVQYSMHDDVYRAGMHRAGADIYKAIEPVFCCCTVPCNHKSQGRRGGDPAPHCSTAREVRVQGTEGRVGVAPRGSNTRATGWARAPATPPAGSRAPPPAPPPASTCRSRAGLLAPKQAHASQPSRSALLEAQLCTIASVNLPHPGESARAKPGTTMSRPVVMRANPVDASMQGGNNPMHRRQVCTWKGHPPDLTCEEQDARHRAGAWVDALSPDTKPLKL